MLIRKLRLQRGWSQEQLAEIARLSVRTIQRVERGYPPSLETRNALAAVFEEDLSSLNAEELAMGDEDQAGEVIRAEEAQAIEYVQGLKSFYQHLLFYLFFILFFAGGIFLVHGFIPTYIQFTLVGWGFGLIFHGLNAFEVVSLFGPTWERKKVEKRLGRKL